MGKETWLDGSIYEGYFENGKKHGKGKYTWVIHHAMLGPRMYLRWIVV